MTEETHPKNATENHERLPCRGCTLSCLNYPVCDGKPWRLANSVAKQHHNAS